MCLFILLQQWELLVLSALKWDISVVTPLDFLEHFLSRLAIRDLDLNKVRLHAQAFICLAAQGKDRRELNLLIFCDVLFLDGQGAPPCIRGIKS